MNKPQDPEAADTAQTTSVPAVDLPRLVRLSSPQRLLLENLALGGSAVPTYTPAKKLVELGLARVRFGKWAGDQVVITDAGKTFLVNKEITGEVR